MSKSKIHHKAGTSQAEKLVQDMEADGFGPLFDSMRAEMGEEEFMELVQDVSSGSGMDFETGGHVYRVRPLENATMVVLDGREVRICGSLSVVPEEDGAVVVNFQHPKGAQDVRLDPSVMEKSPAEHVAKALASCGLDVEPGMESFVGQYVYGMWADLAFGPAERAD